MTPLTTAKQPVTTFSPGPWTVNLVEVQHADGVSLIAYIKADTGHREIAVLYNDEDRVANARLIAAAPTMLEALREIIADAYYVENPGGTPICTHCQELEGDPHDPDCSMQFVIAAIAKAEGRP